MHFTWFTPGAGHALPLEAFSVADRLMYIPEPDNDDALGDESLGALLQYYQEAAGKQAEAATPLVQCSSSEALEGDGS